MFIRKIIPGVVTQIFDTDSQDWINQTFQAEDNVIVEDENGNAYDIDQHYLPYTMLQPQQSDNVLNGKTIKEVQNTEIEGCYGNEPAITLIFTDGTTHTFILNND